MRLFSIATFELNVPLAAASLGPGGLYRRYANKGNAINSLVVKLDEILARI